MANMEHLCTWLEQETWVPRVPASTAQGCFSHVWCQKDIRTQELAKAVNLVASLAEKSPPWCDSDEGSQHLPPCLGQRCHWNQRDQQDTRGQHAAALFWTFHLTLGRSFRSRVGEVAIVTSMALLWGFCDLPWAPQIQRQIHTLCT